MAKNTNQRFNLILPQYCFQRLIDEVEFLEVQQRLVTIADEIQIKSRLDLVRWAVSLYIQACDRGDIQEFDYTDTRPLAFNLQRQDRGQWEYAVRQGWATDFNQLASFALCRYFDLKDSQTSQDMAIHAQLLGANPETILTTIRQGELC